MTASIDRPLGIASSALPDLTPEQVCAAAVEHGLRGVEWGVGQGHALAMTATDAEVDRLAKAATGYGVACCGVDVHEEDALSRPLAEWRRLAEIATALGAPHVRTYSTPPDGDFDADFARLRSRIADRADVVAGFGLRLLLEPAPMTLTAGADLARSALSASQGQHVGVVYDPGSMAREGWLDPYVAIGLLGPLLRHVHVKNVRPGRVDGGRWVWSHTTLADGIVDWARVFGALDQVGYRGWLVLDHLSARGSLSADVAALRALA